MFYVYLPDKQGGIPITADRLLRSIGLPGGTLALTMLYT